MADDNERFIGSSLIPIIRRGEWSELGSRDIDHTIPGARVRERDALEPIPPLPNRLSVASRVISYRLAVIGLGKSGEPGAPGPSDAPGRTQIGTLYKLIVVFVATNPYPLDGFAQQLSDCTMMSAYPNRETVAGAAFELFEIE